MIGIEKFYFCISLCYALYNSALMEKNDMLQIKCIKATNLTICKKTCEYICYFTL